MCVVSQSLCIIAGNDFYFDLQYLEDDEETPVDLTGAAAVMQMLESDTSLTASVQLTGGITDAPNGMMRFTLTDVETQELLPISGGAAKDSYVSDIQLTYVDLTKEVILRASTSVEQGRIR